MRTGKTGRRRLLVAAGWAAGSSMGCPIQESQHEEDDRVRRTSRESGPAQIRQECTRHHVERCVRHPVGAPSRHRSARGSGYGGRHGKSYLVDLSDPFPLGPRGFQGYLYRRYSLIIHSGNPRA